MTIATMSKPIVLMYEAYIIGEDAQGAKLKERKVSPTTNEGYLGNTDDVRALLEKIYKMNKEAIILLNPYSVILLKLDSVVKCVINEYKAKFI